MNALILDFAVEDSEYILNFDVKNLPMFYGKGDKSYRVRDSDILDSDLIIIDLATIPENRYGDSGEISGALIRRLKAGGVLVVFSDRVRYWNYIWNYNFLSRILFDPYGFVPHSTTGTEIIDGANKKLNEVFNKHKKTINWECIFNISGGSEGFSPILRNKAGETISCVLSYGDGFICILPNIGDKSAFIDDFLPAFFEQFEPTSFDYIIAKKEREPDPDWLSTFPVKGSETLLKEIRSKGEVIAALQEESKTLERKLESLNQYRDLLWQTGADWLEPVVKKFFDLLEFECQKDDPIDLVGNFEDKQVRIEIVGTEGPIKIEKARQILQRIFDAEDPTKIKGVLVGNPFRKYSPGERPPEKEKLFVKEVEQMAETHDISLVLTTEMFEVVQKILGDEDVDRGAILRRMFENKGPIKLID